MFEVMLEWRVEIGVDIIREVLDFYNLFFFNLV